ncbi:hypothetical protein LMG27952_01172 [Paraburkholderia hiiakae]|uniref:Holin n=1 Tax=Paraburkholderia hiiakae TaxID=1081782 RepID=A0ABN7HLH3_9BURK|nr:hypothetical protein [Paraburkholderia hiiakae]CAD6519613.1 hypothetical protein LMG27952_01172 [Paraburkholderia hiiakae]
MPMRFRGWLKLALLTFSVDQILTAVFGYATQQIDPGISDFETVIFSCITCFLVSNWLVSDARAAWTAAKKQGFIGPARSGGAHETQLEIANACPRRWLVVLHLELNPQLAQSI